MKNMFGDDVQPVELTFDWSYPHLTVLKNGHFMGIVSPNGWQGYSMNLYYRLGEPYLNNVHLWHDMSLEEMTKIMEAFKKNCPAIRCMICAVGQMMEEKKIANFTKAIEYLKEKEIPLYVPNFTAAMARAWMSAEGIPFNPAELA